MSDDEHEEIRKYCRDNDQRIEKLENNIVNINKIIREYEQAHNFQINELKESIDILLRYKEDNLQFNRDMNDTITELKEHDIFKIWKSVRKGGKTTLSAILNLNQGIKELKEQMQNRIVELEQSQKVIIRAIQGSIIDKYKAKRFAKKFSLTRKEKRFYKKLNLKKELEDK